MLRIAQRFGQNSVQLARTAATATSRRCFSSVGGSSCDIISVATAAEMAASGRTTVIDLGHPAAISRLSFAGAIASPVAGTVKGGDGLVLPVGEVAEALQSAGISEGRDLVLMDEGQGVAAARLWWVLKYYGFGGSVKVLNGGTPALMASIKAGDPSVLASVGPGAVVPSPEQQAAARSSPARLAADDEWLYSPADAETHVGMEGGPQGRGQERVVLLDVRTEGEWDGSDNRGNPVTGRLPGAVHLPHARLFKEGSREFVAPEEALSMLQEAGVPAPTEEGLVLAPYCQSGVRAAMAALVAHSAGYRVRNYDGSFGFHAKQGFAVEE